MISDTTDWCAIEPELKPFTHGLAHRDTGNIDTFSMCSWDDNLRTYKMRTSHYIAMTGMSDTLSLPLSCQSYDSLEYALDAITDIYELEQWQRSDLSDTYAIWVDNELAQIVECDCDDPSIHNDN